MHKRSKQGKLIAHLPKIHPRLFLGNRRSVDRLAKRFPYIDASMCVAKGNTCDYEDFCPVDQCSSEEARDSVNITVQEVDAFTRRAAEQIHEIMDTQDMNLLVHCRAGRNRSVAAIVRYATRYKHLDPGLVIDYIREQNLKQRGMPRRYTMSNPLFEHVLMGIGAGS